MQKRMKKAMPKRIICVLLTLILLVGLLPLSAMATDGGVYNATVVKRDEGAKSRLSRTIRELKRAEQPVISAEDTVSAIVVMDGQSRLEAETAPQTYARRAAANPRAVETAALKQHKALTGALDKASISYELQYEYTAVLNAVAIDVAFEDLDAIAEMDGVKAVYLSNYYSLPTYTVNMDSSNGMTGLASVQASSRGEGTVIAVIDTGINYTHEAFQTAPSNPRLSKEAVADAETLCPGTYSSEKIPFSYDYYDSDTDATDYNGHGTHVAGIAAGCATQNNGEDTVITFAGSAPGAQILAMKVFSDEEGGTSSDIYFAALEDAYRLGADVINMSLGSQNGFVYDSELENDLFGNIYQKLSEAGVVLCISAGNEGSMSDYANNYYGLPTADYADYGTVGSPSTYDGAISVASVENAAYPTQVLQLGSGEDALNIPYYDSSAEETILDVLGDGKTHDFVVVPGLGTKDDFDKVEVTDKIALIMRGEIAFTEKINNATAAGAIAAIIMNNKAGEGTLGMDTTGTTLPAASISCEDAEELLASSYVDEDGYSTAGMVFPTEKVTLPSSTGGQMSDFSSWGCTPSLTLKPTISGVGGNVNSSSYLGDNEYEVYSGTSMASPNVAGAMATMISYLRSKYSDAGKKEIADMATAMLESSAWALCDDYGDYYSPRKQGSGLIDVPAAMSLTDSCYITDPICSVGDSADGVFTISFTVKNLSNTEEHTYTLDYVVQTDCPYVDEEYGGIYNIMTALTLDADDGDFTVSGVAGDTLTVAAGASQTVTLTLTISNDEKAFLDGYFENGCFIEGFVTLTPENDADATIHATYMGFYGDWTAAPILEQYDFTDIAALETELATTEFEDAPGHSYAEAGYTYLDIIEGVTTDVNGGYLLDSAAGSLIWYPGDNIIHAYYRTYEDYEYLRNLGFEPQKYNPARIAIAGPNATSLLYDYDCLYMEPMQLRNARHLIMVVTDAETGKVYFVDDTEYLPKAVYDADNGYWQPLGAFYFDGYDYSGEAPVALPNNTVVDITYYANLAYGEDALGKIDYANLKTQGTNYIAWSLQCTIDNEVPVLDDAITVNEDGTLTLTITDNQYLAYVEVYDPDTGTTLVGATYGNADAGRPETFIFDPGEATTFAVDCVDYALNVVSYLVTLDEETGSYITNPVYVDVTVSPEDSGAVSGNKNVYQAGQTATLTATAEPGYRFLGWMDADGDEFVSTDATYSFTVTEDRALIACFEPVHTVTFNSNGGSPVASQQVSAEADDPQYLEKPADPTRYGYVFAGWYLEDGTPYDFSKPVEGDITLVAHWRRVANPTPGTSSPSKPADNNTGTEKFPFKDVTGSDWFYNDVKYVWQNDLMNGVGSSRFAPDENTTRGMIVTILYRLEGEPAASNCPFTDVRAGSYYEDAIAWAAANSIVDGYGNGKFGPDDAITREQLAAILYRYAQYKGYDVSAGKDTSLLSYADFDQISSYAVEAMQWAVGTELIQGSGNRLMPKATATRAQVAAILHRFCLQYKK